MSRLRTVPALLAARMLLEPDRVAVETYGVGTLTFAEWDARATAVAGGLLDRGLARGDRVALLFGGRDWVDFAVAYCGVQRAGGVAVPCSDRQAPAEIRHVLDHSGATGVLGSGAAGVLDSGAAGVLDAGGTAAPPGPWIARLAEVERGGTSPVDVEVRPGDPAQIIYTSGTTGRSKGVVATHANLTYGSATHPRRRRLAHSTHFLHAFPIGTNAGQTMLLNALEARPTALVLPQFTPARFARLIEVYGVGTVFVVPAMAIELLASGVLDRHDTSSVLLFGSTAAALPPAVARGLAAAFPTATIVNYYTSTEAAPAQTSMIVDPERPGSVGRAVGGDLMVSDDGVSALPAGVCGEVWLHCPFPRAYHGDEQASRNVFRGGWVRMGDVGHFDEEGYLFLDDRISDVIKSGAFKVSTLLVEAALHEHPAVVEAAVVGVPHPVLGTVPAAAVVARAEVSLVDLRAFLADRLAGHEQPTRLLLLDRLPRNDAGKVHKRELLTRFTDD